MYAYIKGKISEVNPTNIVVDNNGIGYEVVVANPYEYHLNDERTVFISQQVREDSNVLYGFSNKEQKKVFLLLLKVKGVGPKSALAILAGGTSEEIISAIENQDAVYLTKFPGIGKKSAQQIILDLQGKVDFSLTNISSAPKAVNNYLSDAILALEALGYSKKELTKIEKKLSTHQFDGVDEYVKQGLKLLMNA
ncbi:MAG: Holliday junction branch migration protein RuvA [Gemella haemolysans]|uniref:Holliday junction branch migration protein RuvA n=1 Tax=Gemella haemolysans TaxID=1379 RepID=UPI00290A2AE0|nr:Holliday junction branch migration protein RuvA [Gemella haemolysans]MDU6572628.1 Holliday junction branch migration protein RuvA [Gemella haemolysans]